MITATVRYKLPPHIDYAACREHFHKIAPEFQQVRGLISKHFIWSESGWAGGVYQWATLDDAKAFYSGPWLAGIVERYGMQPHIEFYEVFALTDNTRGTVDRFRESRLFQGAGELTGRETPMDSSTTSKRIAFVQACWHREVVDEGRDSFVAEIERHGVSAAQIDLYEVPGSLEIPLQAKLLAKTGTYSTIVAAGFVVNGGIYRHEFVAQTVLDALMRVQLETEVPIISLVLTPQSFHEHDDAHQKFFHDHFRVKGAEAAVACVKTLDNVKKVLAVS